MFQTPLVSVLQKPFVKKKERNHPCFRIRKFEENQNWRFDLKRQLKWQIILGLSAVEIKKVIELEKNKRRL